VSAEPPTPTELVERFLAAASQERWHELPALLQRDFELVEPASLPYGGTHRGVDGYVALLQRIGALFELRFEPGPVRSAGDDTVVLRMRVTFTARSTGRSVALRVVELLTVRDGRLARSEVFLEDTAALLATLTP
jgi:ketosteroid isomerase-like protein